MIVDNGTIRQAGRFKRKSDARDAILEAMAADPRDRTAPSLGDFFERWPRRFPRHPQTEATNLHRMRRYVLPYLPAEGDFPIHTIRRSMLREVQDQLLARGLSKRTVDHAFASLSALLNDAMDDELIDNNPARGFTVRPGDPRLKPTRPQRKRRSVPLDEIQAFMASVKPRHTSVWCAPLLTGVRPGELFAARRTDIDRERELIYVHETADRYGGIASGTKTTHHLAEKDERGRWTLFPRPLIELCDATPVTLSGLLFPSPRGKSGASATFTATFGSPRRSAAGPASRCTTSATPSACDCWMPESRWPRLQPGWDTPCARVGRLSTPLPPSTLTPLGSTARPLSRCSAPS